MNTLNKRPREACLKCKYHEPSKVGAPGEFDICLGEPEWTKPIRGSAFCWQRNKNNDCEYYTPKPPSWWVRFKRWITR